MQIAEPNVTFTTIKNPENIFGRQSRFNLTQRNMDDIPGQLQLIKPKLNQGQLPVKTYPKLKNNSVDRLLPLKQNNRDQACFSEYYAADGPFYNRSFYLTSQFKTSRNLDNDPKYSSSATRSLRQTINSFHK
jgi:hypothetical protein